MKDHEVMMFLETFEDVEIQIVNLQSKHVSRIILDQK